MCSASNSAVTGSWNGDSFQHERKCLLEPPCESPFFCFVLPPQRDRNADFLPAHGGGGPEHRHGQGLAKNNWPLLGLEPVGMDLEDVFVKIMDEDEKRRAPAKRRGR